MVAQDNQYQLSWGVCHTQRDDKHSLSTVCQGSYVSVEILVQLSPLTPPILRMVGLRVLLPEWWRCNSSWDLSNNFPLWDKDVPQEGGPEMSGDCGEERNITSGVTKVSIWPGVWGVPAETPEDGACLSQR